MSLQVKQIEVRMAGVGEQLAREFPSASPVEVEATLSSVVSQLRASHRIASYLPVLATRLARERLRAVHRGAAVHPAH